MNSSRVRKLFPDSESPNQGSSGLTRAESFIYSKILSLNSDGFWTFLSNKLNVESVAELGQKHW